MRFGVVKVAW